MNAWCRTSITTSSRAIRLPCACFPACNQRLLPPFWMNRCSRCPVLPGPATATSPGAGCNRLSGIRGSSGSVGFLQRKPYSQDYEILSFGRCKMRIFGFVWIFLRGIPGGRGRGLPLIFLSVHVLFPRHPWTIKYVLRYLIAASTEANARPPW